MYDKTNQALGILLAVMFTVMALITIVCTTGCCTKRADTRRTVLEHQREIDNLESELRSRDRTIADTIRSLEAIEGRSSQMGNDIDEVIQLFEEYQRRVQCALARLRESQGETGNTY